MVGQSVIIDMLAPANILAETIVRSSAECVEPCTVDITVTWNNTGDISGLFTPGVIVDDGAPIELTQESLAGGDTISHTFTIPSLMAGLHTICVSTETGTCTTVTVNPPEVAEAGISPIIIGGIIVVALLFGKNR